MCGGEAEMEPIGKTVIVTEIGQLGGAQRQRTA